MAAAVTQPVINRIEKHLCVVGGHGGLAISRSYHWVPGRLPNIPCAVIQVSIHRVTEDDFGLALIKGGIEVFARGLNEVF
jgi:hypothetical protein